MSIKDFFAEMLLGPVHSEAEARERDEAFWPCLLSAPLALAFILGLPWFVVLLAELLGKAPQ